jgi:hypothetical protein
VPLRRAFTSYFDEQLTNPAGGNGAMDVAVDSSGSVWVSFDGVGPGLGVQRFADGKWTSFVVPGFDGSTVRSCWVPANGSPKQRQRRRWPTSSES